jgi:hypothetical protein
MLLRGSALVEDHCQIGLHHPSQLGQVGIAPLAVEERSAELVLELLDGAGERRLADVALLRGAGEIEHLRQRHEVADLLHFHGWGPRQRLPRRGKAAVETPVRE